MTLILTAPAAVAAPAGLRIVQMVTGSRRAAGPGWYPGLQRGGNSAMAGVTVGAAAGVVR